MSNSILVKSPTRVDFSGGTLDLWPLYALVGGAKTVNLSIDIFTSVELTPLEDSRVEVHISDLDFKRKFLDLGEFLSCEAEELKLVKEVVYYFNPLKGFRLKTSSQSPVGGGLGGSSSLVISLLKAFNQFLGREDSLFELVRMASNIEARILSTPTGTQDYFPAAKPGLQAIHYNMNGWEHEIIDMPKALFSEKLFLVYTGKPHHSGINNWQVYKRAIDGDRQTLEALNELKIISETLYESCKRGEWTQLPELFLEELEWRTQLSSGFSSPEIKKLSKFCLEEGAKAVKICGAGGGGCVLVWSDAKQNLMTAVEKLGFSVINIQPVDAEYGFKEE